MMDKANYRVHVDWLNTGNFAGPYDDISAYMMTMEWAIGNDTTLPQAKAGSFSAKLDNSTSIFSSFNSASPIYGKVLPGLRVRVQMQIGAGSWVTMWQGYLDKISPTVGPMVKVSTATIEAYGVLQNFTEDKDIDIPMMEGVTTGAAVAAILDGAGFSATDRLIDTGLSTMARFWARKGKVVDLLRQIEATETGLIRETKDGKIAFESRAHRLNPPHNTARVTYGTGTLRPWDLQQQDPLMDIYNYIEANIRTFNISDSTVLCTLVDERNGLGGAPIPIALGETKVIDIEIPNETTPSGYLAAYQWGVVDVEVNTEADMTGADITNEITYSRMELGRKLRLTITNTSGSNGFFILLKVHGIAIIESDPLTVHAEDTDSEAKYRKRSFPNVSEWLTQDQEARDYCAHIIAFYKDPRPAIRYTIKANYDPTHLLEAQTIDISDRIHMTLSLATFGLAIDTDMFVEWVSHSVDEARLHTVKVFARKAVTHTWTASGAAYSPKTIYGPGTSKPPDDLSCAAVATGRDILFGVEVWKWNETIDQAEFRARLLASTALNRAGSRIYSTIETQNGYSIPATGSLSMWVYPLEGFGYIWHTPGGIVPDISAGWILCTATGENQGSPRQTQPLTVFGIQGGGTGGDQLRAGWKNNGSDKMVVSSIQPATGKWSLITLTWQNGGDTKLYVDGALAGTTNNLDATFNTSAYNLTVLSGLEPQTHSFGGGFGRANWLGIWNKVLSSDEIAYLLEETPDKVAIPNLQDAWAMTSRPNVQSGWSHDPSTVNPSVYMMANNYVDLNSGPVGFNVPASAGGHDYVDLRTPEEGGTLGIDGCPYIIATGILAYFWGAHYKALNCYEGTWWYAFRLRNSSGWSVWSDGNDTPSRVTDHVTTNSIADTGPPQDWTVWAEADPSGSHAVVIKATRPKTNGNSIWKVWFQARDISGGQPWRNIDDGVGASVLYYDGQSGGTWEDFVTTFNSSHFTKTNPGFQNGKLGVMAIFDRHMVSPFAHANCEWTMPVDFENNDPATARWFGIGIPLELDASAIHLKMVKPLWEWNSEGYFGNEPGHGLDDKGLDPLPLKDPVTGEYGDTTSQIFVSDPIPIPASIPLDNIGARVFFQNGWSVDDDDTYFAPDPTSGIGSGYEIVLTDASTIASNGVAADMTPRKVYFCQLLDSVGATRVLGCPSSPKHRQPFIYIIRQSATGYLNYTPDAKVRVGNDVPWSPSSGPNKQDYVGLMYDGNDDKFDLISFVRGYGS
jgi:hypothetical protein